MNKKRFWLLRACEVLLLSVPFLSALVAWDFPACLDKWLLYASDAREYQEFGQWLYGDGGYCSPVRPYLFPLLLQGLLKAGGPILFWLYHYVLYLATGLLLLSIVRRTTGIGRASWFVLPVYALNFSVAALSLHALTEITSLFLLTLLARFLTLSNEKHPLRRQLAFFTSVLLALVKPLFLYPALLLLAWLIWHERKRLLRELRRLLLPAVSLLLLLTQPLLMQQQSGDFFFSKIGGITLHDYYYQKLYADVNGIRLDLVTGGSEADLARLREATAGATTGDIALYSLRHFPQALGSFGAILNNNLNAGSELAGLAGRDDFFARWVHHANKVFFWTHLAALLAVIVLAVRRQLGRLREIPGIAGVLLLVLYVFLASGISFWQSDRLTVIAFGCWLSVYPALFLLVVRGKR